MPAVVHYYGFELFFNCWALCDSAGRISSHPLLRFSWQPLSHRKTGTVSPPAGDGTAATGLPHRGGRTGLSRPLPGSYWFFPMGMPCLPPRAHDRNRRDSSWQHSGHDRHLMRTALTFNSALPELAFAKSASKCSLGSLLSSFTSSFRLSHPQPAPTFCPPHYSAIMVLSAFYFLLTPWR